MAKLKNILAQQKRDMKLRKPQELNNYHEQIDRLKNIHGEIGRLKEIREIVDSKLSTLNKEYLREQSLPNRRYDSGPRGIDQGIDMLTAIRKEISRVIAETYDDLERRESQLRQKIHALEKDNIALKNELRQRKSLHQSAPAEPYEYMREGQPSYSRKTREEQERLQASSNERIERIEQKVDELSAQMSRFIQTFSDPILGNSHYVE